MKRNRRDWLTGVAVAVAAAALYLSATPSGRALSLTAVGFTPGMPRAEVEARIGGPGVAGSHFHTVSINIRPGGPYVPMAELMGRAVSYTRAYRGPVFVVEVEYHGRRHPTATEISLRAGREWVLLGGLTAMLALAFGTAELTRQCRRAFAARRDSGENTPPPLPRPVDRSWDIRWREVRAGLGVVAVIAVLSLIATPTGRALQYALGILPGVEVPGDVRNLIRAGYDVDGSRSCWLCESLPLDIDPADPPILDGPPNEIPREAYDRYAGPLFAITLEYPTRDNDDPVRATVVPDFQLDGVLNMLGVLLLGVGVAAVVRWSRRTDTSDLAQECLP